MNTSLKQRYPFRTGTTSFIYPADYVTNVRQLSSLVDEIELLLFESEHLPPKEEIRQLERLIDEHGISYNVHLPMDVGMAGEKAERRRSIDAVARAIDRVAPLQPTTCTLHLDSNPDCLDHKTAARWQDLSMHSVSELLEISGVDSRDISIETLDYDPIWLERIAESLDLSVCVDVGHVILNGFDLDQVLNLFVARTTILHLHGVAAKRDHLALTHLSTSHCNTIAGYLQGFSGTVSIEVFNQKRLDESLAYFPMLMDQTPEDTSL